MFCLGRQLDYCNHELGRQFKYVVSLFSQLFAASKIENNY